MAPIRPRGDSGMMISDRMPHWLSVADDTCLLRGMNTDNPQHASATNQLYMVVFTEVRPSMELGSVTGWGQKITTCPASSAFMLLE